MNFKDMVKGRCGGYTLEKTSLTSASSTLTKLMSMKVQM